MTMLQMGLVCTLLLCLTTLFHYETLRLLSLALPRMRVASRAKLMVVVIVAFLAHAVEIVAYAVVAYLLAHYSAAGTLGPRPGPSMSVALFYSAETFTSLGFGDVIPEGALRAIAGFEALNGLLLISWTASFLFVSMQRFWEDEPGAGRFRAAPR
jgi:hypothetical protein